MEGLYIGKIVNYVLTNHQIRPLIVVRVWDVIESEKPGYINGVLLFDGLNDHRDLPNEPIGHEYCAQWVTSTWYDENKTPGTWHWCTR